MLKLLSDLVASWRTILGVAEGALVVAAICTMPAFFPKKFQDWWTWLRDTLQTAVPAARAQREHQQSETVVSTPPVTITTTEVSQNAIPPKET